MTKLKKDDLLTLFFCHELDIRYQSFKVGELEYPASQVFRIMRPSQFLDERGDFYEGMDDEEIDALLEDHGYTEEDIVELGWDHKAPPLTDIEKAYSSHLSDQILIYEVGFASFSGGEVLEKVDREALTRLADEFFKSLDIDGLHKYRLSKDGTRRV